MVETRTALPPSLCAFISGTWAFAITFSGPRKGGDMTKAQVPARKAQSDGGSAVRGFDHPDLQLPVAAFGLGSLKVMTKGPGFRQEGAESRQVV